MLVFWGDSKVSTERKYADCTKWRYSNREVSNSNITITEVSLLQYSSHIKGKILWYSSQLIEDKAIEAEKLLV